MELNTAQNAPWPLCHLTVNPQPQTACQNRNQRSSTLLFMFFIKTMKSCFLNAVSLKINRILSSARSSCFVAALSLHRLQYCGSRASHCSARSSALNAGIGGCSVRLQCYTAELLSFWKAAVKSWKLDLVEQAKCSPMGLNLFCHSCGICEQSVFFSDISIKTRRVNLLFSCQVGEKGAFLAAFLCTPKHCTKEVCMLHCFPKMEKKKKKVFFIWFFSIYSVYMSEGMGEQQHRPRSRYKTINSCLIGVLMFFSLNDLGKLEGILKFSFYLSQSWEGPVQRFCDCE